MAPAELNIPLDSKNGFSMVGVLCSTAVVATLLRAVLPASASPIVSSTSLPSYPLAVKNPYLSSWVPGNYSKNLAAAQPQFWDGTPLTWPVLARVNNEVYALFGVTNETANVKAATTEAVYFTASHTYFELTAGPASFTLDYYSPVLPGVSDYARHSLPYSYLTVSATSNSTSPASIQVLSAIDYSWTAQGGASNLNYSTTANTGFFWYFNPNAVQYAERGQMASYGSIVFATNTSDGVTSGCDSESNIYSSFIGSGELASGVTSKTCNNEDLAALVKDLGSSKDSENVTFAVGLDREQAINYLGNAQTGAYRANWPTIPEAVEYVLGPNFGSAVTASELLDQEIQQRGQQVSSVYGAQYAVILEASLRQAFGAIELTVPASNTSAEPWVFLKEISSDGNVNTVDVVFQSWPIFISLNPNYIRMLFLPILEYLQSGAWPYPWVVHDLGSNYPNATGHDNGDAEQMPLFETSTLFILLQAYTKYTGDHSVSQQYAELLEGYAQYLAPNSLYPASQLISVDAIAPTANQTALAIQSAIGLNAAGNITSNSTYKTIALSNANQIYTHGLGLDGASPSTSTHFTYNYGENATWNVLFAAYSDVLLGLNTFPSSAWELQSSWYEQVIAPGGLPFAGPNNETRFSSIDWGLTDWSKNSQISLLRRPNIAQWLINEADIEAAAISSTTIQQLVINTTYAFLTNGLNTEPFGTKYVVEGNGIGTWLGDEARSTVGTHFAILALKQGWWYNG